MKKINPYATYEVVKQIRKQVNKIKVKERKRNKQLRKIRIIQEEDCNCD